MGAYPLFTNFPSVGVGKTERKAQKFFSQNLMTDPGAILRMLKKFE